MAQYPGPVTVELPPEWEGGSLDIETRVTRWYPGGGPRTPRQITVTITVDRYETEW